jgi:hypothetical protein
MVGVSLVQVFWELVQWPLTWRMRTAGDTRKHLISIKTKRRNRYNIEPALILTLMKICPEIEALAHQKQA